LQVSLGKATSRIDKLVDAVEEGAEIRSVLGRLEAAESQKEKLEADLRLAKEARSLQRELLDAEIIAEDYQQLPRIIEAAQSSGAQAELQGLLRAVIDVVEWWPDPTCPKTGEALIQLFQLPAGFWQRADGKEQPGVTQGGSGSPGCNSWRGVGDSNPWPPA
jgi:hypothetical protein